MMNELKRSVETGLEIARKEIKFGVWSLEACEVEVASLDAR
jgi:hypothetical protein